MASAKNPALKELIDLLKEAADQHDLAEKHRLNRESASATWIRHKENCDRICTDKIGGQARYFQKELEKAYKQLPV